MPGADKKWLFLLSALVVSFLACLLVLRTDQQQQIVSMEGQTMGTRYRLLFHDASFESDNDREKLLQAVDERLEFLDSTVFSTYANDSQLSRFNRQVGTPVQVASELMTVLLAAGEVYRLSDGAFDVTIKPVIDLWGFGAESYEQVIPDPAQLELALSKKGMRSITLNKSHGTIRKGFDLSVDLSAIAKGFAVDDIARLLESLGFEDYLVEIGGELVARGSRPDGSTWQLGIERPDSGDPALMQRIKNTGNRIAVAASGNYRNFFLHEGRHYSHVIDPRTGWPISNGLVSVTVVSESAMLADAWATALMVLGPEEGVELANELQLAAYFILGDGSGFQTRHSDAFNRYF